MLRTSLDKTIHLLTLRLLTTITTLANSDPALVSACFDILAGCVSVVGDKAVILQGSEEVAAVSVLCCVRTLAHITATDPASSVLKDVRRRYTKTFPIETNFKGLPSSYCFRMIHNVFHPSYKQAGYQVLSNQFLHRPKIQWKGCKLPFTEHLALVQLAQFRYQRKQPQKMPRWILRYARHLLSQDPLPPTSVIADCLSIVAMDVGCTVSNATTLGERYVHIRRTSTFLTKTRARLEEVLNLITEKLKTMARSKDPNKIVTKRKAVITLFRYAFWRERNGDDRMVHALMGFVRVPNLGAFMAQPIATLLAEADPDFKNQLMTLLSPSAGSSPANADKNTVTRWAAAVLAVPYTEEVSQSVVDTLSQIASYDDLLPRIPVDV